MFTSLHLNINKLQKLVVVIVQHARVIKRFVVYIFLSAAYLTTLPSLQIL
jgi:hypothetical protein